MTFRHGKGTVVYLGGYDVSGILNASTTSITYDTAEVTTYPSLAKEYIPGMDDGTVSLGGYLDVDPDGAGAELSLADRIAAMEGVQQGVLIYPGGGEALGAWGKAAAGILTSHAVEGPVDGAVTLDAEIQANNGVRPVTGLHVMGARTATGNGSAVDSGISGGTAYGGEAYLQVSAASGTGSPTLDAKVQGSADGSSGWADLATFTTVAAADAPTSLKATWAAGIAGSTPRYLRAVWTIAGSGPSFTFAMAAYRRLA
jgi:hypothetical protein